MLCPSPLVSINATQLAAYPGYVLLERAYDNCYVPCPNIELSASEWDGLKTTILALVIVSFVTSFLSCASHIIVDSKKYYMTIMFIGGFCLYSFFLMIFLLRNRQNEQICYDDAAYIERGGLCVAQSASSVFLFLWIEIWSVLLAYDSLRQMHSRVSYTKMRSSQDRLQRSYTVIALVSSAVIVSIPLIAGSMGYDPRANIPMCFFIGSATAVSGYFWWSFFLPFYFLLLLCIFITVTGMVRINRVLVLGSLRLQRTAAKSSSSSHLLGAGGVDVLAPLLEESDANAHADIDIDIDIDRDMSFGALSDRDDVNDDDSDSLSIIQDIFRLNDRRGVPKVSSSGSIASVGTSMSGDAGIARKQADGAAAAEDSVAPAASSWAKMWSIMRLIFKYNSRNIIFVSLFGISTLALGPLCINTYYFKYSYFIDVANEFVDCLVQASLSCPTQTQQGVDAFAQQQCGLVPSSRPHLAVLYSILTWVSSYGIIPALVYGAAPGTVKAIRGYVGKWEWRWRL